MIIIGEAKPLSPPSPVFPEGWRSEYSWTQLVRMALEVSDMVSIHTHARWDGSFALLGEAVLLAQAAGKPVMAKGFHADDKDLERAFALGAANALVVGNRPIRADLRDRCFVEPYSLEDLQLLPPDTRAVWNSRDLRTMGLKKQTFSQAREVFDGFLIQASNISTLSDIHPEADGVIIGRYLPEVREEMRQS